MAKGSEFIDLLKRQGYEVTQKKLGGGFVNDVRLVTARKGGMIFEYVLKKYGSERDVQNMLRGYDALASVVKTPTIVYHHGREVAYDFVKGRSIKKMLTDYDPKAPEAIRLLARELESLHRLRKPSRYKRGDSPDERKMLKHIAESLRNGQISRREADELVRMVREYIPREKAVIHGDAHLGNFLFSDGDLYFIDPDDVKLSDPNADLGKVLYGIESLADEGKISKRQARELRDLFLEAYRGEDPKAVRLFLFRTPLIVLRRTFNLEGSAIRRALSGGLEGRVTVALIALVAIVLAFLNPPRRVTGLIVDGARSGGLVGLLLVVAVIVIYFLIRKRNEKKKPANPQSI